MDLPQSWGFGPKKLAMGKPGTNPWVLKGLDLGMLRKNQGHQGILPNHWFQKPQGLGLVYSQQYFVG